MTEPDRSPSPDSTAPSPSAVRGQLERILASEEFASVTRMKTFLRYVVEEALSGRDERIKEPEIATVVFDRDQDFDPRSNTIVRVEAGRLRRRLERYYLIEGPTDGIRIDLPKGTYVPIFRRVALDPDHGSTVTPDQQALPAADRAVDLPSGPSIAVLPFENLSGDPDQEFFADGITDEVINDLTRFPDLRVIARHSSFKHKGAKADIRDIGKDLGVSYLLQGSVRKGGDVLRVTCQLVDAQDGAQLFSETYDRNLSSQNVLEIQDDISDRIVAAVGQPYGIIARTSARRAKRRPSSHMEAYDAVLRFYEYWVNHTPERHAEARAGLERAVEIDPDYASAWAALAETYLDEVRFSFNTPPGGDSLDRALAAAQRAVRLDPENPMAYHFLFSTHFHRHEIDEFRAAAERAVALNPNQADLLVDYGIMLAYLGEWDRGRALTDKAIALSPTHPGWFHTIAVYDHYRKDEFDLALDAARKYHMPGFYWSYVAKAICYGQMGMAEEAREAVRDLLETAPDVTRLIWERLDFWMIPPDLARKVVDGLRKAGLAVPDRKSPEG